MNNISFTNLPILPENWLDRKDVRMLMGPSYYREASKTCTEDWKIVFLIAEGHHVAYRVKVGESFGYGG